MADATIEIEGDVSVSAETRVAGFEGEDPAWVRAYLAASARFGLSPKDCETFADDTIKLLQERRDAGVAAKARQTDERRAELAAAIEEVRKTGTYVNNHGDCYDVINVYSSGQTDVTRRDSDSTFLVHVTTLTDPDDLLSEYGLRAAPESAQRDLLARLKVAAVLGVAVEDMTLVWDGDDDAKAMILDIDVKGCRPRRATWDKLRAAGVPMYADPWKDDKDAGERAELERELDEARQWLLRRPKFASLSVAFTAEHGFVRAVAFFDTFAWIVQDVDRDIAAQGSTEVEAVEHFERTYTDNQRLHALHLAAVPVPHAPLEWRNLWDLLWGESSIGPLPVLPVFEKVEKSS